MKKMTLTVISEGSKGHIECKTKDISFGSILVHNKIEKDVTLFNTGDCDLHFKLGIEIPKNSEFDEIDTEYRRE